MIRVLHVSALRAVLALAISLCGLTPAGAVQRTGFDHLTTGFELQGAHRDLSCEYCHARGVFKGTPRTCPGCHAPGSPISATSKPLTHIASAGDCSLCHAGYNFWPVVRVDHTAVNGSCFSCHNGLVAEGKTPDHIPSDNNCDACHTTIAFNPQRLDHTAMSVSVKSACRGCHSGVRAAAAPRIHAMTTAECGTCHTTLAWSPARLDHSTVSGACQTCHNGATAIGKVANHVATSLDCSACHRYPHWRPVLVAAQTANASGAAPATTPGSSSATVAPPGRNLPLPGPRRPVLER
jgi:hypothetical protein